VKLLPIQSRWSHNQKHLANGWGWRLIRMMAVHRAAARLSSAGISSRFVGGDKRKKKLIAVPIHQGESARAPAGFQKPHARRSDARKLADHQSTAENA